MSDIKWTDSQWEAITKRNTGIVVSAAAGSGKTTVMIERLSQLLLDENNKIPAENLLAVTFTNKAASQMREKLNKAIDQELAKCLSSDQERDSERCQWLLEQKNNLQFAKVSTINSFCLEFVKDNISSFEFQSGLKILDEATEKMLFDKALDKALEELCDNSPESYLLLRRSFGDIGNKLTDIIREMYKFLRTIPFRNEWIEQAKSAYKNEDIVYSLIEKTKTELGEKIEEIRDSIPQLEAMIDKLSPNPLLKTFVTSLTKADELINDIYSSLCSCYKTYDVDGILSLRDLVGTKPRLVLNKGLEAMDPMELSVLQDMCRQAADIVGSIYSIIKGFSEMGIMSHDRITKNLDDVLEVFDILLELINSTERIMYSAKIERNAVDFSDVEMMTKDLLVEMKDGVAVRTQLCEDIRKSEIYKLIMIDEFQDVNNLQELIFRALSDINDLDHLGRNVFVVGDIKQAIYRFRQTNPELFKKSVDDANKGFDDLYPINLQENFRSREGIIDFANFIFKNIMYEKIGGVDYDDTQKLSFGAKYYPEMSGEKSNCVELLLCDVNSVPPEVQTDQELYLIARKIKSILKEDSGYLVTDSKTKKLRHCRPSDICILMQTNLGVTKMSKALNEVGLQAFSQDTEGYLKSAEITLAVSILRVIDNPLNDIAMTSMLMSPILAFTATDMLKIQKERTRTDTGAVNGIYTILSQAHLSYTNKKTEEFEYRRVFDDEPELQKKCFDVYTMIENFIYRAMSTNLERLIRYIFDSTELLAVTSLYLDSQKKRANLLLFLQYARDYEQSGYEGVSGFIRFLDSVYNNDKAFKQAGKITSSSDSINVMTFHASKGLEFPYVFLCGLINKGRSRKEGIYMHYKVSDDPDDYNCFAFEISDAMHFMDKTNIFYTEMNEKSVLEDRSEKLRLLYVGCTRAMEKLFVSLAPNCSGNSNIHKGYGNMMDVIKAADEAMKAGTMPQLVAQYDNMLYWFLCGLSNARLGSEFCHWLAESPDEDDEEAMCRADEMEEILCDSKKPALNADVVILRDEEEVEKQAESKTSKLPVPAVIDRLTDLFNKENNVNSDEINAAMLPSKLSVTEIVRQEHEQEAIKNSTDKEDSGENISFNPDFFPSLPKLDDNDSKLTPAEKGTFTHKFMELASYPNAEISVRSELDRLVERGFFSAVEASGVYVDRLEAFFRSDFYKRMKNSEELLREKSFLVSMKDIDIPDKYRSVTGEDGMIQGIADCVFKEPDGYVIVDYKTDNFRSAQDMDKYSTQLAFYKAALELVLGSEQPDGTIIKANVKSCYIYSFKLGMGKEYHYGS